MNLRPLRFLLLVCLLAMPAAAQPLVLVTTSVLQDFVQQVGGDAVRVERLVPAGVRTPDFEPNADNLRRLEEAQCLVVNGAGFEPWLAECLRQANYEGPIIIATQGMALLDLEGRWHEASDETTADFGQGLFDPYAWHDPANAVRYVANINGGLASLVPARAGAFRIRADAYTKELQKLLTYTRAQFATLGAEPDHHLLATPLQNFNYFAAANGLKIVPIPGLASGQEIRPAVLERLLSGITQLHVPAVFFESTANAKMTKRIADETHTKVVTTLFTDDLGPAGTSTAFYLGMIRANVDTIVHALK
jgi:zinc/manganese transport system substrate-binding protein